jgi:hypothetical protein
LQLGKPYLPDVILGTWIVILYKITAHVAEVLAHLGGNQGGTAGVFEISSRP